NHLMAKRICSPGAEVMYNVRAEALGGAMRRLCNEIFGIVIVLLLAAPAGFSAQQQQPQSSAQTQPAATPDSTQAQQPATSTDASQQPAAQDQTAGSDEDQTMKGVKPGSAQ